MVICRKLKHEEKRCMEELQCNIVAMKHSHPKVLRLNLVGSPKKGAEEARLSQSELQSFDQQPRIENDAMNSIRGPTVTPSSSPELFTATEVGTSSVSSSDHGASPFFVSGINVKKAESFGTKESLDLDDSSSDTDSRNSSPFSSSLRFQRWMVEESSQRSKSNACRAQTSTTRACLEKFSRLDREARFGLPNYRPDQDFNGSMREAVSLSRNAPLGPPPLCSICQLKAPVFGKPPRWFTYSELELATGGFSRANFLAEGGFGSVHRGVLSDGRTVAVKQHKLASSQGDQEFCSEVEVLSCAQHRNVVMLIGFCIEDRRRLLVYEYICNGSLDSHLYGNSLVSNSEMLSAMRLCQ